MPGFGGIVAEEILYSEELTNYTFEFAFARNMKKATIKDLEHLEWAIESRAENQHCAIRLLKLLIHNSEQIKSRKLDLYAQGLVGVTFSLWRAAFLADKTGMRKESFESAIRFLGTLIADNAINYSQDKQEREWTFNYYTTNVRNTMVELSKKFPNLVPKWDIQSRPPKERWRYGQDQLTEAVKRLEDFLKS